MNPLTFGGALAFAAWLSFNQASVGADLAPITTEKLLTEMTDLEGLATFPSSTYTCKQLSSYDRAAKSPTENWFANNDAGNYLRVEQKADRKEYVMMDTAGPGALLRFWSANPDGVVRIYIDGADKPALEAPMQNLLGGKFPGLPRPIAGEYSRGWTLYFPIPYAKSCKVTTDKGPNLYYHLNYRTYPTNTIITSFKEADLKNLAGVIEKVAQRLSAPSNATAEGDSSDFELSIPAGATVRKELDGPAAITRVMLQPKSADLEAALRGTIIKITFDNELCVEAPLGDMFGSAPGLNPFTTLPLGMTRDSMYSQWFMPFKTGAVVEFVNTSGHDLDLSGVLTLSNYDWTEKSMHFHAKWRAQFDVPTRPMRDWNYLTAKGQGVFAGVSFSIDNPVKNWWGEGDEKIYVDGETFPGQFGTGTEDYYGYAWCSPELFTHAYHSQSRCDGPGNYGRTSVNRFDLLERIPFTKDIKFDMELWHWSDKSKVNMAVTAYWYALPGATDTFAPIKSADAIVRPMPAYQPARVAGAIEGETLKIVKVTGTAEPQNWDGISGECQLWWHAGMKPGDTLILNFPAPKAGKYRVFGCFLSAKDYGIHQLAINGKNTGAPTDFYNETIKANELDLGIYDLKEGDNAFSATITGANEKALKAYMLGLDYLRLQPTE